MTKTPEHAIINYIYNYNNYNKYNNIIYNNSSIKENKELWFILEALSSFMHQYSRDTNALEQETYFWSLHSKLSSTDRELYHAIFSNIAESVCSDDVIGSLLDSFIKRSRLVQLAVAAYESSEGRTDISEVTALSKALSESSKESVLVQAFVTDDLNEIYSKTVLETGLRWRLKSLNQSIGSLRKGDFGFVFARPETGKTTFLASECTFMAGQADGPVLWFNNEEQGEKVMLRCYQAALGNTLEQLFSSIERAREKFKEATKGNLCIVDEAVLNKREVETIVEAVQPSLIVFDQIDKIGGFAEDRDDLKLGAIYQWARELAKSFCPVIGICQADGTAEGVKWLTMAHVSNAKTSKQAEADWILGIGRTHEAGYEDVRHFCISKNKLVGDSDSIPSERHGRWDVLIEPLTARYKDILT